MPILAARSDVEFVGVSRLGADELRQVKDRFGFQIATEDVDELLRADLDGVVVTSPHTLHYAHARAALERGLHVMVEKPMTTNADQARELARLAAERGRHLVVPYGWNYRQYVTRARRWLDEGAIGRVEHVSLQMASALRGLLSGTNAAMGGTMFDPDPATWADPAVAGGGYGYAQLSHATGLLFYLFPDLRAESVFAMMSAPGARVDMYDAISARFVGGAIGTVSGAGTVPRNLKFHLDLRVFGTEGMLVLDIERERLEIRRNDGVDRAWPIDPGDGNYTCDGPPNRFVDLILGRDVENASSGDVGARSVELLDAAYRSAQSGASEFV
ncbi:MAG: Gfo/Idh/MocA family oxidoreductase [Chloroflexota bacterium]|nr:MAG: Gfo/Idh/MocA family oxidoreductase [Chloroflexota bacterium]